MFTWVIFIKSLRSYRFSPQGDQLIDERLSIWSLPPWFKLMQHFPEVIAGDCRRGCHIFLCYMLVTEASVAIVTVLPPRAVLLALSSDTRLAKLKTLNSVWRIPWCLNRCLLRFVVFLPIAHRLSLQSLQIPPLLQRWEIQPYLAVFFRPDTCDILTSLLPSLRWQGHDMSQIWRTVMSLMPWGNQMRSHRNHVTALTL